VALRRNAIQYLGGGSSVLLFLCVLLGPAGAFAADAPSRTQSGGAAAASIGVLSAGNSSTDVQVIADVAEVLDDGVRLRIVPIIGQGGVRNIDDLLALPLAGVAIVQSDVLSALKQDEAHQDVGQKLVYIAKLFNEEVHVLARRDVDALAQLSGRKVAVGAAGSGSSVTAAAVFSALGIQIQPVWDPPSVAIAKLSAGEVDAVLYVAGKPAFFAREPGYAALDGQPLHLLAIPTNEKLLADYVPSTLSHQDYPDLIEQGQTVETISVPMVMVAAAMPKEQAQTIDLFVEAFFSKFPLFQEPARHPKWRETNLAATIAGWPRLPAAVDWVRANMATPEERKLQEVFYDMLRFIRDEGVRMDGKLNDEQLQALFWRFVDWRAARTAP
jgi:TRAP-type uncharacterized transport system substrate-binding protein